MNQKSQHVLVVDDEPDIRELLHLTLSRMGLEVTTAEDLADARRALQSGEFSFCLTDMRLPDGNGLDLVSEICATAPEVSVLLSSGYSAHANHSDRISESGYHFLPKPYSVARLLSTLQLVLQS